MPSITTPGHRPSRASISRAISEATPKAILAQLKAMALYSSAFITSPGRASHGGFIFWGMKKESGSFQEIWNLLVSKCLLYSTYSIYIYTYLFICVHIYIGYVYHIYIYIHIFSSQFHTVLSSAPAGARSPLAMSIPWSSHLAQKKVPQAEK